GTAVTFTNVGELNHTATAFPKHEWDTGDLASGEPKGITFTQPGIYYYICTPHPWILGQLILDYSLVLDLSVPPIRCRSGTQSGAPTLQRLCFSAISLWPNRCRGRKRECPRASTARHDWTVEWCKLGNLPVA